MRSVFSLAVVLLLVACSGNEVADGEVGRAEAQDGALAAVRIDSRIVLPGGVYLDSGARLRADTISQTEAGANRRTLVIELLDDGPDSAKAVVTRVFARAGYRAAEPKAGTDGKTGIRYAGADVPSVWVVFYPDVPSTPAYHAAKSRISVSWQVR